MDRRFNDRHRSSNSVFARTTLATAPPKIAQRFITAGGKTAVVQRLRFLRWPSVHELSSSGAKL